MSESLADKIAGVLSAAPATFDPEDDVHEETAACVVSGKPDDDNSDEETLVSRFRKQNVDFLEDVDKRYEGKKCSRKKLLGSDDWESEEDDDFEGTEDESNDETSESVKGSDEMEKFDSNASASGDDAENEEDSDEDNDDEHSTLNSDSEDTTQNFKHMEESNIPNQIKKGMCVRHQLSMWENLLEIRIQLQKCMLTANKLPQSATYVDLKDRCGNQFTDRVTETKRHVSNLLEKLLLLQSVLLKKYPETKSLLSQSSLKTDNNTESDEEIPSDTEDEENEKLDEDFEEQEEVPKKKRKLRDFDLEIRKRFNIYKEYRNSVIQKWNDKTRIAASKSSNLVHSVNNQIEHILSDKEKLIKRTQLKRMDYVILGVGNGNENSKQNQNGHDLGSSEVYNANIFDDTDFYHHLLRELIEFKSADLTDPVQLGRQWIQLQNLRSKMKRKIDTKATKGRKIRYVVHSKLVNFMAPIEEGTWQNQAKTELYNSLFGKNQPVNTI